MTKIKKLEQEIKELKDLVLQLQSQLIALQARNTIVITPIPSQVPVSVPQISPAWPSNAPYYGDELDLIRPTIMCKTVSGDNAQSR